MIKKLLFCLSILIGFTANAQKNLFSTKDRINLSSKSYVGEEIQASLVKLNSKTLRENSFIFNPFNDISFIIDQKSTPNNTSWVGTIEDQSFGYVILSERKGEIYGKVVLDSGDYFLLEKQNNEYYRVSKYKVSIKQEDCEYNLNVKTIKEEKTNNPLAEKDYGIDICDTNATCSDSVIDVLVLYSDVLLNAKGSVATIEAAVQNAMDEANLVVTNTNLTANHRFNLIGVEKIDFTEEESGSDNLSALRNSEIVSNLRNKYYADIVALILDGGSCGIGSVNSNNEAFESSAGFSVTRWDCMTGNLTLTHEIGHNIGFRHNRYSHGEDSSDGTCDYAYGYVNQAAKNSSDTNKRWRTVMAYNDECSDSGFNCARLPYFSNPDVSINGDSMGVILGNINNAANNRQILERSACHVAAFRSAPDCDDCIVYQACETYAPDFDVGPGSTLKIKVAESFKTVSSGATVEVCLNLYGDNNASSEQFNVLGENGVVLGETTLGRDCDIPTRTCFTISAADYNTWINDGVLDITIDPSAKGVNPTLCSQNFACAEIIVENATLGVDTLSNTNEIAVIYPNPTSSIIFIDAKSSVIGLKIFNSIGKQIKYVKDINLKEMNIADLAKGIYFLEVITEKGKEVKKVIKN